ncbi:unnamed protein product [Prunus armeniaca]|uniref:Uncharacterized protein n=1 Tax=Prunus armeniaca TaxID=36596 RepID=A0A6J5XFQ9_PRUAR|nr:unnamed protein product [Prunus armeniaca]
MSFPLQPGDGKSTEIGKDECGILQTRSQKPWLLFLRYGGGRIKGQEQRDHLTHELVGKKVYGQPVEV